jgi:C-terminal processing protease CtpA/Prc
VAGFWEGSAADKLGIDIGDELVMINGKKIGELSPTEVDNIYYNNEIREIDVVYKNKTGLHKTKATKEMLLPPL